ncbi:NAD(P)-binding domain-containing protein [Streptomyces sp. NPDC051218]|uniref:NAD(P)-binding domain-containing protein n=1 Tax=Streptomyces sp. NPDC051218 TaxID=3365645 RepID=UPI0037B058DB
MTATGTAAGPVVGWIGLSGPGLPMARAVAVTGFPLHAWARRFASRDGLGSGLNFAHDAVEDLATACGIACLCVGTDDDVSQLTERGPRAARPRGPAQLVKPHAVTPDDPDRHTTH